MTNGFELYSIAKPQIMHTEGSDLAAGDELKTLLKVEKYCGSAKKTSLKRVDIPAI